MISYKETIEAYTQDGLTWRIEKDATENLCITIIWPNGEEIVTLDLSSRDVEKINNLFDVALTTLVNGKRT
jgi:hypothetical protein